MLPTNGEIATVRECRLWTRESGVPHVGKEDERPKKDMYSLQAADVRGLGA
jgi:hypothetical protein